MESSSTSTSANSSFGSTASSTSPRHQEPSENSQNGDRVIIKQEPSMGDATAVATAAAPDGQADAYDRGDWAHIMDESGAICLDFDDDDDPMDEEDIAADPRRVTTAIATATSEQNENGGGGGGAGDSSRATVHVHDPTPSSALLDNWGYYDEDMLSHEHHNQQQHVNGYNGYAAMPHAPSGLATALPLLPVFDSDTAFAGARVKSEAALDVRFDGVTATPSYSLAFETQANGQPLPLSKPLVRDDGLLIVGTELVANSVRKMTKPMWNRLFITHVGGSQDKPYVIKAPADIRDLQWLGHASAIAAIGSDMHVLRLATNGDDDGTQGGSLSAPLRRVHADTIRELAINYRSSVTVASGGFDETVVLTKLGEGGDPASATMDGKIDAYDVVSSLRWHPTESGTLSWTTDGGDFQLADVRARTKPQLQVALHSFLEIDAMGGLFGHEYISATNVVLGFQSGQLLFLDLRKPRKQYCYGVLKTPLGSLGEMRRSATGTCAMFGVGGFATATVDSLGREFTGMTGVRPPHAAQVGLTEYKTSGDFSLETGSIVAVSDNLGVVSVYDASRSTSGSAMASPDAAASDSGWHERAV